MRVACHPLRCMACNVLGACALQTMCVLLRSMLCLAFASVLVWLLLDICVSWRSMLCMEVDSVLVWLLLAGIAAGGCGVRRCLVKLRVRHTRCLGSAACRENYEAL